MLRHSLDPRSQRGSRVLRRAAGSIPKRHNRVTTAARHTYSVQRMPPTSRPIIFNRNGVDGATNDMIVHAGSSIKVVVHIVAVLAFLWHFITSTWFGLLRNRFRVPRRRLVWCCPRAVHQRGPSEVSEKLCISGAVSLVRNHSQHKQQDDDDCSDGAATHLLCR